MATRHPVVIITDLDRVSCPVALLQGWLGTDLVPPQLVLRIAVREIESWLLADHDAMRRLIGSKVKLPAAPDDLPDPKQHLLLLAEAASRDVREDLVKAAGAVSSQGIAYNARLVDHVVRVWSPDRALQRSPSLRRAPMKLRWLRSIT